MTVNLSAHDDTAMAGLEQGREREFVRSKTELQDMGIEGDGVCIHVLVHVTSDYGVVREGGRVGGLIEEATCVVDAARCMERAECDEAAGFGGEIGSDGAGVDLPEL